MVYCTGCGKEIHETATSCPRCGAVQRVNRQTTGTLWLPVPALILAIVVVLALFDDSGWDIETYIGVGSLAVTSLALAVFSLIAQEKGKGLAIGAVITASIGLLGLLSALVNR